MIELYVPLGFMFSVIAVIVLWDKIVRFFGWLVNFPLAHTRLWRFLRWMTALPAAVVGYASLPYDTIIFMDSARWAMTCLGGWGGLWLIVVPAVAQPLLSEWESAAKQRLGQQDMLAALVASLDAVVGTKMERFGTIAKQCEGAPPREHFLTITQPEAQIRLLAQQLFACMRELLQDKTLKLVLFPVYQPNNANIIYFPENARPEESVLISNKSLFQWSKSHGIGHINDIAKWLSEDRPKKQGKAKPAPWYVVSGDDGAGSIVAIPIMHSHLNRAIYVVTFKSQFVGLVDRNFAERYSPVLTRFFNRICLEYSLFVIRNNTAQGAADVGLKPPTSPVRARE